MQVFPLFQGAVNTKCFLINEDTWLEDGIKITIELKFE